MFFIRIIPAIRMFPGEMLLELFPKIKALMASTTFVIVLFVIIMVMHIFFMPVKRSHVNTAPAAGITSKLLVAMSPLMFF